MELRIGIIKSNEELVGYFRWSNDGADIVRNTSEYPEAGVGD